MLKQHEFYVYYEGNVVFARMGDREPIVAMECETPQEAQEEVQKIVNPKGLTHKDFPLIDGREVGFHHPDFQAVISPNCEGFVKAAYAKAGVDDV